MGRIFVGALGRPVILYRLLPLVGLTQLGLLQVTDHVVDGFGLAGSLLPLTDPLFDLDDRTANTLVLLLNGTVQLEQELLELLQLDPVQTSPAAALEIGDVFEPVAEQLLQALLFTDLCLTRLAQSLGGRAFLFVGQSGYRLQTL